MTSSADRDDDLKEQWPFPKSGPIATKDIPLSEPSPSVAWLDRPHRDPDVATFLNSGTAITVSDIVHSLDPGKGRDTIWLHHDGSLSRGNVDPIEFSTAEEIDRRIELGLDPQDHPGSTHAGSVKIRRTSTAVVDVQYTDSMSEAQKMTLGRIDHAVEKPEARSRSTTSKASGRGRRAKNTSGQWSLSGLPSGKKQRTPTIAALAMSSAQLRMRRPRMAGSAGSSTACPGSSMWAGGPVWKPRQNGRRQEVTAGSDRRLRPRSGGMSFELPAIVTALPRNRKSATMAWRYRCSAEDARWKSSPV